MAQGAAPCWCAAKHHLHTAAEEDFAFETTLSSRTFAFFLRKLKAQGYRVAIYYFSLSSPQLAVRRVKLRVALLRRKARTDAARLWQLAGWAGERR